MHRIEPQVAVSEYMPALSRTAATYNGTGLDLTLYRGGLHFEISVGNVNTTGTLVAKLQESDDNSSWSDVAPENSTGTIAAAGAAALVVPVRSVKKRYARINQVVATAAVVYGVTLVSMPLKAE